MHTPDPSDFGPGPRAVPVGRDAKVAFGLSAAFGAAAAVAAPLLIGSLPPQARELPLPLWAFCVALAFQMTAVYGVLGLGGMRLARSRGVEPTPFLGPEPGPRVLRRHGAAFCFGLACGVMLVATVGAIQRWAPGTLPPLLHPPSFGAALMASVAGSIGEEILFRLFVLGLLLRLLPRSGSGISAAVAISSLAFGAAHSPGFVFLYGGLEDVPPVAWLWLLGLNGLLGAGFAVVYLRAGIAAAVLAHFGTDLVWHAAAQLGT